LTGSSTRILQKKNSWSSSQTAKKKPSKTAQDRTLEQGKGLDMGGNDKGEAGDRMIIETASKLYF
jgi:hypothetical protein